MVEAVDEPTTDAGVMTTTPKDDSVEVGAPTMERASMYALLQNCVPSVHATVEVGKVVNCHWPEMTWLLRFEAYSL